MPVYCGLRNWNSGKYVQYCYDMVKMTAWTTGSLRRVHVITSRKFLYNAKGFFGHTYNSNVLGGFCVFWIFVKVFSWDFVLFRGSSFCTFLTN